MKFNRRLGREEVLGSGVLDRKISSRCCEPWSRSAMVAAWLTISTTWATAACARWAKWLKTSSASAWSGWSGGQGAPVHGEAKA